MTVAARRLHLTQGAVSQQIKRLEVFFGTEVFRRDKSGAALTREGERLLPKAKRLIAFNDDLWADMHATARAEKIRLGVPFDLIGTHLPPILKAFSLDYPDADIALISGSSPELRYGFETGEIDLAVIESPLPDSTGERLATDRLVWVSGAGSAHRQRPLPICFVSESCTFRPAVFAALTKENIAWKVVFENASIDATSATVRGDLAVTTWLRSTVPAGVRVLEDAAGLPDLPELAIDLLLSPAAAGLAAQALALRIREYYAATVAA